MKKQTGRRWIAVLVLILLFISVLLLVVVRNRMPKGKTGLYENNDGTLTYYEDGEIAYDYTNIVEYEGLWRYVENGQVDWTVDTFAQKDGQGDWFRIIGNRVFWGHYGQYGSGEETYFLKNGTVDPNGLEMVDSGYRYDSESGFVYYGFTCRNQYERQYRCSELSLVIRDPAGTKIKELELAARYPGLRSGESVSGGGEVYIGQEVGSVTIYMSGAEETDLSLTEEHPQSENFSVTDVSYSRGEHSRLLVNGVVHNDGDMDAECVYVTILIKKEDNIIGGFTKIVRNLKSGETREFHATSYGAVGDYDSIEVEVTTW